MTRFLMCPPKFYTVEYEINPWMSTSKPVDHALAEKQWNNLYETIKSLPNTRVELIEPAEGMPDLVFTANAGVVKGDLFISARFRHPERQMESPHFEEWFADRDYRVEILPEGLDWEGAGDLVKAGNTWFGGYYFRTDQQAQAVVSELLQEQVLPLRLVDERFYHLDTALCGIRGTAIYYPGAFDEYGLKVLKDKFPDAIEATEEEAEQLACNAVVVGNHIVMNKPSERLKKEFLKRGLEWHAVELTEFLKSGGSARCLTLRLEG